MPERSEYRTIRLKQVVFTSVFFSSLLSWKMKFSWFVFLLLFLLLLDFSEFFSDILGCFPEC